MAPFDGTSVVADTAWRSWTPNVTAQTGSFTLTTPFGRYVLAGKTCHWTLDVILNDAGTAAGEVRFTLPATAAQTLSHIGSGREDTATGAMLQVRLLNATTGTTTRYDNASPIGTGRTLRLSGTFELA